MIHIVGIGDLIVSNHPDDIIVTHSLGSCIGIAVCDVRAGVGGMIHYKLPTRVPHHSPSVKDLDFGEYAIPTLFHEMYRQGANKKNIRTVVAGGMDSTESLFKIGEKNRLLANKLLWKNKIFIDAESVGGNIPRTLYLKIQTGQTWYETKGKEYVL